jgi:hypothetical protein
MLVIAPPVSTEVNPALPKYIKNTTISLYGKKPGLADLAWLKRAFGSGKRRDRWQHVEEHANCNPV